MVNIWFDPGMLAGDRHKGPVGFFVWVILIIGLLIGLAFIIFPFIWFGWWGLLINWPMLLLIGVVIEAL